MCVALDAIEHCRKSSATPGQRVVNRGAELKRFPGVGGSVVFCLQLPIPCIKYHTASNCDGCGDKEILKMFQAPLLSNNLLPKLRTLVVKILDLK